MRLNKATLAFLLGTPFFLWNTVTFGGNRTVDACASLQNLFEQVVCYAAAAKAINDLEPCDQANHEGVRYQCYAIFAEHAASPDICYKIPTNTNEHRSLIDVCLSDVALKAHDPTICESILTPGLRDSCYFKLARKSENPVLCQKIKDDGLKSACTGNP